MIWICVCCQVDLTRCVICPQDPGSERWFRPGRWKRRHYCQKKQNALHIFNSLANPPIQCIPCASPKVILSHSNHQSLPIARDTLILVLVLFILFGLWNEMSLQQTFSEVSNRVLPYVTDFDRLVSWWRWKTAKSLRWVQGKTLWESLHFISRSQEQKVSKPILMVTPFIANFCSFSLGQNFSVCWFVRLANSANLHNVNMCVYIYIYPRLAVRTHMYKNVYICLSNDHKIPTKRFHVPIFIQKKMGHR